MARYDTTDWLGNACRIIEKRARQTEEFNRGIAAAHEAAAATMTEYRNVKASGGNPIDYMRSRGGWPSIIGNAFAAAVGDASIDGPMGRPYPIRAAWNHSDHDAIMRRVRG